MLKAGSKRHGARNLSDFTRGEVLSVLNSREAGNHIEQSFSSNRDFREAPVHTAYRRPDGRARKEFRQPADPGETRLGAFGVAACRA